MSKLILVRHGQASLFNKNYDCLSPIGTEQSRLLGQYWLGLGLSCDQVFVGPKKRHLQTFQGVAEAYQQQERAWPKEVLLPELDEHQGLWVVKQELQKQTPSFSADDEGMPNFAENSGTSSKEQQARAYFLFFQKVLRQWVRNELDLPQHEDWAAFNARIAAAIQAMTEPGNLGQTLVAFTSGGPLAAACGYALGLDLINVLEFCWIINNVASVELNFSEQGITLERFNALPHIQSQQHITLI